MAFFFLSVSHCDQGWCALAGPGLCWGQKLLVMTRPASYGIQTHHLGYLDPVPVWAFKVEGKRVFPQLFGPCKLGFFFFSVLQCNWSWCGIWTLGLLKLQAPCEDQTHLLESLDPAPFQAFKVTWEHKLCSPVALTWRTFPQLLHCLAEF